MSRKNTHINANDCIKEYFAGKSIKQLAVDNGVSRQVIYRIFRENDVPVRNRSEAMFTRMANTTFEERQRLAFAANEAKRGLANTPEMLEKRAKETSIFGLCKFYIAFSRRRRGTALAVDEAHCNVGEGYANA